MFRHSFIGGRVSLQIAMLAVLLVLGGAGWAEAVCPAGYVETATECQLFADITATGTTVFTKTVHLFGGSSITAQDATGFTLLINPGDFIMEDNSELDGDQPGSCPRTGAPITVDLRPGQGNVDLKTGSSVHSNACQGGFIQILTAGAGTANIDGIVESVGTQSGSSNGRPGGGPITIVAGCKLTISDTGEVRSQGRDPGADLIHLEGCVVEVFGLVESFGVGHTVPVNNPPNSCSDVAPAPNSPPRRNPVTRPGKPQNSTACVEIWSGTTVLIDSTGDHKGQVRADTGGSGGSDGTSWIEIVANGDITIKDGTGNDGAPNNGPKKGFAVHANGMAATNDDGGLIDVITVGGSVITSGKALQASHVGVGGGGGGGTITVLARLDVNFGTANIEARGKDFGGGAQNGGVIFAKAYDGQVVGAQPGELDVFGGPPQNGTVTLEGCDPGDGLDYNGTIIAGTVILNTDVCGGVIPVPAYVVLPAANCLALCGPPSGGTKQGTKFNDLNGNGVWDKPTEPGLADWTIKVFDALGVEVVGSPQTTGPDGTYAFNLPPGTYTVCEVSQAPTWTQTFPVGPGAGLADCTALGADLAQWGYLIVIQDGTVDLGNDFGNHQEVDVQCPEDETAVLTRTVNTLLPNAGTNHHTVQAAYAAAANGEVIGLFSNTVENITLGGAKSLEITQCTLAQVTALSAGLPVWNITTTGVLTIIGPDSVGGTVGWRIQTGGHTVSGVRASGASVYGIQIIGNDNTVSFNEVNQNAAGVRIEGDSNDVRGGTVWGSFGNGVEIAASASGNTFRTATVRNNAGFGIGVAGAGNTVRDNKAAGTNGGGNAGDGIFVTGTANTLQNNETSDNGGAGIHLSLTAAGTNLKGNQSNRGAANGNKENGGPEYQLEVGANDQGGNKADNVAIPQASKCPTFPAAGNCGD